jgi:uncharacterized membrane protein YgcG
VSDARQRWKEKHRRQRVRARWLDPLKLWTSNVLLVAAAVCLVLTPLVAGVFLVGFFAALIAGLLVRGMSLGEILSHGGGGDPGYTGDGGGGGDGGGSC